MLLYASLPAKDQLQTQPHLFDIYMSLFFYSFLYFSVVFSNCIFFLNCSLFCSDVIVVGLWLLGAIIFSGWLLLVNTWQHLVVD